MIILILENLKNILYNTNISNKYRIIIIKKYNTIFLFLNQFLEGPFLNFII